MHKSTPLAPETVDSRRRYLCRHIFTDGHRCASPALRGHEFCYYHRAARPPMPLAGRTGMFTMPRVDDRAAIQIALFEILSRISAGDIDLKHANSLLYGLQIASSNLPPQPRPASSPSPQPPLVEEITRDLHLGDLAPIVELPAADPALPPASAPSTSEAGAPGASPLGAWEPQPDELQSVVVPTQAGCPTHDAMSVATWAGADLHTDDELRAEENAQPPSYANTRVPILPSCFANAPPEIIPSHAVERAHVAEEIHSAVQSAMHRRRPALSP